MKKILVVYGFLMSALLMWGRPFYLSSPSGEIKLSLNDADGAIKMQIEKGGSLLLAPSPIGLTIQGKETPQTIKKSSLRKNIEEKIIAPFHHTPQYSTRYNEMVLELKNGNIIEFRAFDDGVAYRYKSLGKEGMVVKDELLELNLPGDPIVYLSHSTRKEKPLAMGFQNFYSPKPLSKTPSTPAFLPATVDYGNGRKMTLLESDLESYPGIFLKADSVNSRLKAIFAQYPDSTAFYRWRTQEYVASTHDYLTKTDGGRTFPWRIFAITDKDTEMPVNNLVYTLASPSRVDDISWVKPGKAAWEWWNDWGLRDVPFKPGINNDTYKYFIDFAADNNIEFLVLDEGWYDPQSGDMLTTIDEIDLPMLAKYAEDRGVGLWLWTVFNVLDSQLEEACDKYSRMGIKGFKVDFLDRNDAQGVEMTYRIAEAAAKHKLMLDFHGYYTPTGLNRTYPNIINYESVFGMEEMKWSDPSVDMPEYEVTFPYIRMMAGSVDFTPGAMRNRTKSEWKAEYSTPMSQGTRAHQMAHYVVHDSPFTMLADSPSNYLENRDCLAFISSIPSEWDETRILDGEIGEYIVTLRKKDKIWLIGGQTDWNPRDYELEFSFLPIGSEFKVTIVKDGMNADKHAEDHEWETFTATSESKKKIQMAPGGGFVVRIDPFFPYDAPGALNPVIPGYFADPTIKKFDDTYYVYATTDGSGAGFGPAQLWQSKDLVNWTLMPMNWPDSHWIWAPDVMYNQNDGKYYYVYCQPCQIHVGAGETPRGPWQNILGESEAVLVPDRFVTNAITLDGQTFVDDDGSIYMYWGTWGIYKGFGCGAGKLTPDMKGFTETRLIPNTEVTDFFEAPFVFKKDGTYYFMYSSGSCHDDTYRVQYATSDRPLGPYIYQGCILETNSDGSIHGPGHHSMLQEGDDWYIVYHRHDNPHSNRGFHRQVCIDKMEFTSDGKIRKVVPTHEGVKNLGKNCIKVDNLAYGKKVRASSFYDDDFKPEYAVDDNNGTLWRPAGMGHEWIEIDLGKIENIKTILTQWEYGTQFYQYLIEISEDGKDWEVYSDKRRNRLAGSPMVDFGDKAARYVRITSTGGEKSGFNGALWNVKIYDVPVTIFPQQWIGLTGLDWNGREWENNQGQLGGTFQLLEGTATPKRTNGRDAVVLQPSTTIVFENPVIDPESPFTATAITLQGEEWQPASLDSSVSPGKITIQSGDAPLTITDIRYYNWELTPVEKKFDAQNPVTRNPVAAREIRGKLVDLNFDKYNTGDTVPFIENQGYIYGYFEPQTQPGVVKEIKGRKALEFDGTNVYTSGFPLPPSVRHNSPYTMEAVVLNPEIDVNECYADFTSSHDELEKIMGVNGTEPRCGIMNHYGWYEDAGYPDVKQLEGEWQHIYVCFDGRIEKVYVNGNLASEKDIQLLVKPVQYITLGQNAEHEWPFTGYLHSLKFYDECIPYSYNDKTTL